MSDGNEFEGIADQINRFKEEFKKYQNTKVNLAIIGASGSGKSTLINALAGTRVTETSGVHSCTGINPHTFEKIKDFKPRYFEFENFIVHDLPGFGDKHFSASSYLEEFNLQIFDAVIFVLQGFNGRVYQPDIDVLNQVKASKVPHVLVLNQFDQMVENNKYDSEAAGIPPSKENELKHRWLESNAHLLEGTGVEVFCISARFRNVTKWSSLKITSIACSRSLRG